jgi:hypothetical protein
MDSFKLNAMMRGKYAGQVNHAIMDKTTGNLFLVVGTEADATELLEQCKAEFPENDICRAQRLAGSFVFKEAIDIEGAPNVHAIIEKEFKKGK